MTNHGSDRINRYFGSFSHDVTPAPAGHAARVRYVPSFHDPEMTRHCASVLSEAERTRAHRFASADDRARFEQRRAFRRFCGATVLGSSRPLSEIRFEETEGGRPFLPEAPDLWFSFSSCRLGMLGAWSPTHGVGVDMEDCSRLVEALALARRFFSDAEADAVAEVDDTQRLHLFYRLWTLKEAALKSIGEGLPYGLDTFQFELKPEPRVVRAPVACGGPASFDSSFIEGTKGCAALVTRSLT